MAAMSPLLILITLQNLPQKSVESWRYPSAFFLMYSQAIVSTFLQVTSTGHKFPMNSDVDLFHTTGKYKAYILCVWGPMRDVEHNVTCSFSMKNGSIEIRQGMY